jgi:hypothetical protein
LTGRIIPALDCTFIGETLLTFQEQLLPFPSTLATFRIKISSHKLLLKYGVFSVGGNRYAELASHPKYW